MQNLIQYFATLIILQLGQVESNLLNTCCKYQTALNEESGECEKSSYEFDKEIFPNTWTSHLNGDEQVFELKERDIWCKCVSKDKLALNLRRNLKQSDITKPREWIVENPLNNNITLEKTSLTLNGKQYKTGEYCLNKIQEQRNIHPSQEHFYIEIIICKEECKTSLNLKKIFTLSYAKRRFKLSETDLKRTSICEDFEDALTNLNGSLSKTIKICPKWVPFYHVDDKFYILRYRNNSTIAIQDETYPWAELPFNTFCKPRSSSSGGEGKIIKFCLPEIRKLFWGYQKLYGILAGISAIFLLFNLTIYFALRDSLSISGWTEFLYSLSLYCYFVGSIVGLLLTPEGDEVKPLCYVVGVLIQFFELAISATLVALSFDIFWTFCKFDKDSYTDDPKQSKMRLTLYILFTLAFPMSMVTYGVIINHKEFGPQYGLLHCTSPAWPLSSFLQFLMQGFNLILVMISAYIILNKKNKIKILNEFDQDHFLDPDRLDIFSKLLIFVFLYWIVAFMEFFFQGEIFPSEWNLVAFRTANYSQGVFAFLILICNRKSLKGIFNGEWSFKGLFHHACCTSSKKTSDIIQENEDEMPMSPLMKSMKASSIRRSTVRGNAFY